MRILMACAAFPPFIDGGGPISALAVAKLLIGAGHEVEVVNVAGEDRHEIYDGVPVHRLRSLNVDWNYRLPRPAWKKLAWHALENFNPRAFAAMRREIRRVEPDLVLTDSIENVNVATWGAAKSLGVPTCHILRSTFLLCWRGSMRRRDANCGRACGSCRASSLGKKAMSRFVDAVVGETDFIVRRHLDHGYFPNAMAHRVTGAIPAILAERPRSAPRGRPVRFGFIGVHDPGKGLDTLARAARRLAPRTDVAFVVAGSASGDYARSVPGLFEGTNTRLVGWTAPADFFPTIDALVVPSVFEEPFGRVAIEAFAQGVPVVGARSGGIPETITQGRDGFLFAPGDDAGLAGILAALADDPAALADLSAGALASAARYLPDRIAGRFDAFFASLVPAAAERSSILLRLKGEGGEAEGRAGWGETPRNAARRLEMPSAESAPKPHPSPLPADTFPWQGKEDGAFAATAEARDVALADARP